MWHLVIALILCGAAIISYGMAGYYWGVAETKNGAYRLVEIPGLIITARIFAWLAIILFVIGALVVFR